MLYLVHLATNLILETSTTVELSKVDHQLEESTGAKWLSEYDALMKNAFRRDAEGRKFFLAHEVKKMPLHGRIQDRAIQFWWSGKWRPCRYYGGHSPVPSKKILDEALTTFRLNVGRPYNDYEFLVYFT